MKYQPVSFDDVRPAASVVACDRTAGSGPEGTAGSQADRDRGAADIATRVSLQLTQLKYDISSASCAYSDLSASIGLRREAFQAG